MIKTKKISEGIKNKVYDISLDGTFVNGLGMNVLHNTDGFDFAIPDKLRYTKENPYIGKGRNRDTKEGKEYIGVEGDVAEFDDMFLDKVYHNGINKMGLGIDEFVKSSINIKRKNYLCWMEEDDSIKKVGNTVKSRKMPGYLQNFFNKECQILIRGDGYTFLKDYYDYIDDIYNYRIPVKDIASRGKFKKSIKEYNEDCNTLTKAGNKKSRQAWYELAIQNGMSMDMGETLYYINTGKKKSESDVKRVTHKYLEDGTEVTGRVITELLKQNKDEEGFVNIKSGSVVEKKAYNKLTVAEKKAFMEPFIKRESDEIILNCKVVPLHILETDKTVLCSDVPDLEYNVEKYIDQFNSRIKSLLVVFSTEIRDDIIITNPDDRKEWTKEQAVLVSGQPINNGDQDTYAALMTPEPKEIEFWLNENERPPFVDDIEIPWDSLVEDYKKTKVEKDSEEYNIENQKYLSALNSLTKKDYDDFEDNGKIPLSISSIVELNPTDMKLYFKKIPDTVPSTGGNIYDDLSISTIDKVGDV